MNYKRFGVMLDVSRNGVMKVSEVKKYIDYYNNRRPHRRLNFKSPSEIEAAYYESLKA